MMNMNNDTITKKFTEAMLADIEKEVTNARTKFDNNHTMNALTEEVGELAQALLQLNFEPEKGKTRNDVYKEAVQVATMAIRVATEGDASLPAYKPFVSLTENNQNQLPNWFQYDMFGEEKE